MISLLKFLVGKVPLIIASTALIIMTLVTTVHVIGRNLFGAPIYGGVEIISLAGVVLISFAVGFTQWERAHIVIEVLVSRLPDRYRLPLAIFALVISLGTTFMLIWGGVVLAWDAVIRPGSLTLVLHLPSAPFKFIWVAGCIVLWGYFAYHLIDALIKVKKK